MAEMKRTHTVFSLDYEGGYSQQRTVPQAYPLNQRRSVRPVSDFRSWYLTGGASEVIQYIERLRGWSLPLHPLHSSGLTPQERVVVDWWYAAMDEVVW
jgi:hypothetical protein